MMTDAEAQAEVERLLAMTDAEIIARAVESGLNPAEEAARVQALIERAFKNTLLWVGKHPKATMEMLGFVPSFLRLDDPAGAREQFNKNYSHGGGWRPFKGFSVLANGDIQYPGDPPMRLLAEAMFRGEIVRVYENAWVAVVQPDGSFEISRMD